MIIFSGEINDISNSKEIAKERALEKETIQLLSKGVDESNISQAIEILLRKNSNYSDSKELESTSIKQEATQEAIKKIPVVLGVVLIFLIASFPPKFHIGFGKGQGKLKKSKIYRWLLWGVPLFIVMNFIIPLAVSVFSSNVG